MTRSAPTPAVRELQHAGVPYVLHTVDLESLDGDVGYGLAAARALATEPARVFKTLLARLDGGLAVAVVSVADHLDLKALAVSLGGKRAEMADPRDAERATGYVVGGISPLGQRRRHRTVVDASMPTFSSVFVSGGRRGLDVELAPADLVSLTGATIAPIAR